MKLNYTNFRKDPNYSKNIQKADFAAIHGNENFEKKKLYSHEVTKLPKHFIILH